jgi:hypothetical protein
VPVKYVDDAEAYLDFGAGFVAFFAAGFFADFLPLVVAGFLAGVAFLVDVFTMCLTAGVVVVVAAMALPVRRNADATSDARILFMRSPPSDERLGALSKRAHRTLNAIRRANSSPGGE